MNDQIQPCVHRNLFESLREETDEKNGVTKRVRERISLTVQSYIAVREEINESIKQQYQSYNIGLTFLGLLIPSAIAFFLINWQAVGPVVSVVIMSAIGCIACGFLYLLLTGEIRIMRGAAFCKNAEHHWVEHEGIDGKDPCSELLWEHYVVHWNARTWGKKGRGHHFERRTLYMPFRILISVTDFVAAAFVLLGLFPQLAPHLMSADTFGVETRIASIVVWIAVTLLHVRILDIVLNRVNDLIEGSPSEDPGWLRMFKVFCLFDVIRPKLRKDNEGG